MVEGTGFPEFASFVAVSIMQRTLTFYNTIPRNQWITVTGKTITRGPVTAPASEYLQVYNILAAAAAAFTPVSAI